jgi:tetratricopeptide (TPR) repeat protein
MGCTSSSEAAQTHHVLHHFPCTTPKSAREVHPPHPQRIVGRAVALNPNDMLHAPSSRRRCLYWKVEVWEEYHDKNFYDPQWRVVLSKEECAPFELVDEKSMCVLQKTNETVFRVEGSNFRKAKDTTEIPHAIRVLNEGDDKTHVWGQTFTYAGGVQTGVLQTGHYKFVEATITENDLVTVLCYVKENADGTIELTTFPKEAVYQLGTHGWTKKDKTWWDNIFREKAERIVVSNRLADTDGVRVKRNSGTRCTFCSLVSSDPQITGLPNGHHDRNCKMYVSTRSIQPVLVHAHSEKLTKIGKQRKKSSTIKCLKGHPLRFEPQPDEHCSWCKLGSSTQYHCDDVQCNLHMCMDCYELTRDAEEHEKKNVNVDVGNIIDKLEKMAVLAPVLVSRGRLEQAEDFFRRVYVGYRELEGDESLDVLLAADALAVILQKQKNMEEAEILRRIVLKGMEQMLGNRSQNTLKAMDSLANLLYAEGKLKEAEALYITVIELEAEVLGKSHPGTLRGLFCLAEVYEKEGKIEEAIPVERRLLEVQEHNMGLTHPKTNESRAKLISLLQQNGKEEEAKQVMENLDIMLHASTSSPKLESELADKMNESDALFALA